MALHGRLIVKLHFKYIVLKYQNLHTYIIGYVFNVDLISKVTTSTELFPMATGEVLYHLIEPFTRKSIFSTDINSA